MNKLVFLCVITGLISGCGFFKKQTDVREVIVTKVQYVHPQIPTVMFKPCIPEKPIAIEQYMSFSYQKKEDYLTDYIVRSMAVIKDCNGKLSSISTLIEEQKKLKETKVK